MAKKVQKVLSMYKVVVLLLIPIPFWMFWLLSLPSDLRVPTAGFFYYPVKTSIPSRGE